MVNLLDLQKEGKALTVHGDGEFKRDYIHVTDVAKACIASIESRVKNEIFNVEQVLTYLLMM